MPSKRFNFTDQFRKIIHLVCGLTTSDFLLYIPDLRKCGMKLLRKYALVFENNDTFLEKGTINLAVINKFFQ